MTNKFSITESDKQFFSAVNRWRNENEINKQILAFIDELIESVNDDDCMCDQFDDGFDACAYMVKLQINKIINGANNAKGN